MWRKTTGAAPGDSQRIPLIQKDFFMKMLIDLFSTDYGLMSIAVIFIILAMAVYFTFLFMGKIKLDAPAPK